jgi:putative iron-only hydrogenase system regulator
METRVAVISLIVSEGGRQQGSVEGLNAVLHRYAGYIVGRMGLPYREKGVNIICVAVDAPLDVISAMSGKLGSLSGVSVKTAYAPQMAECGARVSNM